MRIREMRSQPYPYSSMLAKVVRRFIAAVRHKGQYRNIHENLCNLLVDDPVVRLQSFQGVFVLGARSHLFRRLLFKGSYEETQSQCCARYLDKDRDAIDVGANVGFYTVLFAKLLGRGRVLAIEPTAAALRRLYRNIELNQTGERTLVFEGAASNEVGIIDISVVEGKEEYASIGKLIHPAISAEKYRVEKVNTATLDELVKRYSLNPGFVKIDAEGAEHLVFHGSCQVLEKMRPVIFCELYEPMLRANGSSCSEVIRFIERYDYSVSDPSRRGVGKPFNDYDILCIPKERPN